MHNNYKNILYCVDILSVAIALGLAMDDAPPSERGEGSESGEESAEEEGEDSDNARREAKKERKTNKEEEKGKGKLEEEETAKMGLKVGPAPSPNLPPTPSPETFDHIFLKASGGYSERKGTDNEEMKEVIKEVVDEQVEYDRRTGKSNLMRGKMIDGEKETKRDKVDQKEATGDRGEYEHDVREVSMGDQGITEAEFVKHEQEYSLAQAPILDSSGKEGLHSKSGRELETAAAVRDAKQTYAALRSPRSEKRGLHSNTRRELVEAASARAALTDIDHEPYAQETPALQAPKPGHSGLHFNTHRELVAAGMAREADIEFRGPFVHDRSAQPPSLGNKIHSNTERGLEAATLADPLLPAKSGLHSSTERELEPVDAADPLLPTKSRRHSNTERELKSEGGARKAFRRLSERSLIRTGVVATLHIGPAHYLNTASDSKPAEREQTQHKQEQRLSQKELVGSSYAESASSYPSSSKDASGAQIREKGLSQRKFIYRSYAKKANSFPGSSMDADPPSADKHKRKWSENDLVGLVYAAFSDIAPTDGAGPSNAPQASSPHYKTEAPWPGPSSASFGERDPPPNEISSFTDGLHFPGQRMDLEPSTDIETVNEDFGSRYTSCGYISDSGQHRYATQRDLNYSRRCHPYEQAMASTKETRNDEDLEEEAGSQSSNETPSAFLERLRSAPDADPNPDPDHDEGGEGMPEPNPDEYIAINTYPPPPRPDEEEINIPQPISVDHGIDSYYPPPDEGTDSSLEPISYVHNDFQNYNPDSYSTVPMPSWPWNRPNGDYFLPFQLDTSQFSSIQAPQQQGDAYRVRHPRDRMLGRRPRCGLHIVTAMRRDKTLPIDRRKENRTPRTPGSVDVTFSPRVGDVILRHVRLPGQGAVEIWHPSMQTEDGDSLVRFKLDPFSYDSSTREASNLLIVEAKGFISFENMWIYMGSATHSVLKAEQRVLGVGARDGRTIYAM